MASNNFKGRATAKFRKKPEATEPLPAPVAPVPGDFVITRDRYSVETWWKVCDAPPEVLGAPKGAMIAVHTKGNALRIFAPPLTFLRRTELRGTACWDGGKQ